MEKNVKDPTKRLALVSTTDLDQILEVRASGKEIISKQNAALIDNAVKSFTGSPLFHDLIYGGKREITPLVFTQVPLYEEISCKFTIGWTEVPSGPVLVFNTATTPQVHQNVLCKGLLDNVVIDQEKKEIRIFDFKTKSDVRNFHKSFINFSYGIQGAFYYALMMKVQTEAPRSASARQVSKPMPELAPVTRQVLPARLTSRSRGSKPAAGRANPLRSKDGKTG